jgi:inorganic pyrophosphatase
MNNYYNIYIEIEKHSNLKYEYDRESDSLQLDRILPYPYFYPYAYGFFKKTLGNDGDELDALLLTNQKYNINENVDCKIIGGLIMEDEKGMDEKIFVVPLNDDMFENLSDNDKEDIYNDIIWFFSNYKSKEKIKWSKVHRLMSIDEATDLYNKSVDNYNKIK